MIKKIIATVVGSFIIGIILLSFIEVYYEPEATESKSFTYALGEVKSNLGVDSYISIREMDIITATSRGLVMKNSEGKIENVLAEEIKTSKDNIQYEFKLKENIKWSNGEHIEAKDIIDYFKELIILANEEDIGPLLNIYGAKEFRESEGSDNSKFALIEGDNSVIIRLNSADKNFVQELTKPIYRIRKKVELWKDIDNNYKAISYSGDYKIEKITNEMILLKKNKYNENKIKEEIQVLKNINGEVSMAKFETGDIDIVVDPPSQQLNRLAEEERLESFKSNTGKYVYINTVKENSSYNQRRTIYKNLVNAMEKYYKENPNNVDMSEYTYFHEDKKNLNGIQERKVKTLKGKDEMPEIITLLALDTQENRGICEYLQKWFKENTKSTLRYSLVNGDEYKNISFRDRYDITLIGLELNPNDRVTIYEELKFWYSENEEKVFKRLKETGKSEFRELEINLFNNYKILPLVFDKKNIAVAKEVKGIRFDYYGNLDFSKLNEKK